jgi:hypothetical protein
MWYLNGNPSAIAAVYNLTTSSGSTTGGFYVTGVVSGVNDVSALASLSFAPNPANEQANFTLQLTEQKEVNITLYNSVGQEVGASVTTTGSTGENKIAMPVADLPEGVYFAIVSLNGEQVSSDKIVVTH